MGNAETNPSSGQLIRVPIPVTGNVERRLIAQLRNVVDRLQSDQTAQNRKKIIVLEFDASRSGDGGGSEFEDCLKLARFLTSPSLKGITTVAFLPQPLKGHALLVVMACDQVMMSTESSMTGLNSGQGANDPTIRSSYLQIAARRKTFPEKIAESMIDPSRKLLRVETDQGNRLVFANELKELKRTRTINSSRTVTIFPGGETASLTARQARDFGVVSRLVKNREDLEVFLGLAAGDLRVDSQLGNPSLRPRIFLMDRFIDDRFVETRKSMIDQAMREDGVNFICLWIDRPDGSTAAVSGFADFLSKLDTKDVRTVAYIPTMARGIIPLIALACDDVVMHPDALLGGKTDFLSNEERSDILAVVNDNIVPLKMRNRALTDAMFTSDTAVYVFRNRQSGALQYLTESDWKGLPQKEQWDREAKITTDGQSLQLNGEQAEDVGVARGTVRDFQELKRMYGLEGDPGFAEPSWVNRLIGVLASPELAWLIVLVGLAGIYAELQLPGIGIGGFVATVAFTLFFWANFMNHTANELEIVLFLVGVSCLVLEIFVIPGFGIFGLGGGILMLIALILASQTFVLPHSDGELRQFRNSLMTVGLALGGLMVFAILSRRFLPHAPLLSRLILSNQTENRQVDLFGEEAILIGAKGRTVTDLRPSGKANIRGELVDVIAEGEWISIDTPITIIEVHGTRIVVKLSDT
ncbi:MAG: NfeD family protein [Planctomycetota bacterium]|nr:NfeD family protein [Planctomycetota bacterium]